MNQVPLLTFYKINYILTNGRRENDFNQNAGTWGDGGVDSLLPENHLWRLYSAMKIFKGEKGSRLRSSLELERVRVVTTHCVQDYPLLVVVL